VADLHQAALFLRQYADEDGLGDDWVAMRMAQVRRDHLRTGTYAPTADELTFGGRVAWRNSARCIGRFYWRSLRVVDRRHATSAEEVFEGAVAHLVESTNGGRIRPTLSVFPAGVRILNSQLVRYAGHRRADGVVGDPANLDLTDRARALGWQGEGTAFDVLPLLVAVPGEPVRAFPLPPEAVLEVPLVHPDFPWFAEMGLRWHALPAIADHVLSVGGVEYSCAPFSGWYMGTEIGARNLADSDRYDLLGEVASRLGLDRSSERTLWRDQTLLVLNEAVLHSFDAVGATVVDHHTESHRFIRHIAREEAQGRRVPADWSWIVPPVSGAATPVFHRYYDEPGGERPNFLPPPNAAAETLAFAQQ